MAVEPGARLGPYEIVELRGRGGMGEVYRARDTRLGRDVAMLDRLLAVPALFSVPWMKGDPKLASLHDHPDYLRLLEKYQ